MSIPGFSYTSTKQSQVNQQTQSFNPNISFNVDSPSSPTSIYPGNVAPVQTATTDQTDRVSLPSAATLPSLPLSDYAPLPAQSDFAYPQVQGMAMPGQTKTAGFGDMTTIGLIGGAVLIVVLMLRGRK
jgi:hypothetical protein